MGFRGEKFAYRNLKKNKFFPKQPPSSVFEQIPSSLSRVSLHSPLICIQDCRCSSARHLPLFSFPPFLAFFFIYLAHPLSPLHPPPFLPWPCEKCPKVSNNVTRISKLGSVLETLFIGFLSCVFLFFFFFFFCFFLSSFDPNIE